MANHTSGPWHTAQDKGPPYITSQGANWRRIATTREQDDGGETLANSRIIAACPELLAACRLALARLDRKAETCRNDQWKAADQTAWEAVSAAIQKAEHGLT